MNGNVVNYDNFYDNNLPLWGKPKLDVELKKYLKLLDGNNVLDLGIGEGQNSIALSEMGYKVTGVDFSDNSLSICRKRSSDIELIKSDIRSFDIVPDKYDLIISRCVLHFLHKEEVLSLFSGFDTVFVSDEFGLDLSHGSLQSHGVLKYVGRKV